MLTDEERAEMDLQRHRETITLDEGQVWLSLPGKLSPESVADFEWWIKGIVRKVRRRAESDLRRR